MTDEQIKQNAKNFAINETGGLAIKYFPCEKGYIAGAHSRDEEIKELEQALAATEDVLDVQSEKLDKLRNPWISVEERLPEKLNKFFSDFVLVMYTRGGKPYPFITRYDYECGMWEIDNVTHWMPIPQIKKGGEK